MTNIITSATPKGYGPPRTELKPVTLTAKCENCNAMWEETHKVAQILNQTVVYDACTYCIHNSPELKNKYLPK